VDIELKEIKIKVAKYQKGVEEFNYVLKQRVGNTGNSGMSIMNLTSG